MDKLKERAGMLAGLVFVLWLVYTILGPLLNTQGTAAAEASTGADEAWGAVWAMENLGTLFLVAIILAILGVIMWELHKKKQANGG